MELNAMVFPSPVHKWRPGDLHGRLLFIPQKPRRVRLKIAGFTSPSAGSTPLKTKLDVPRLRANLCKREIPMGERMDIDDTFSFPVEKTGNMIDALADNRPFGFKKPPSSVGIPRTIGPILGRKLQDKGEEKVEKETQAKVSISKKITLRQRTGGIYSKSQDMRKDMGEDIGKDLDISVQRVNDLMGKVGSNHHLSTPRIDTHSSSSYIQETVASLRNNLRSRSVTSREGSVQRDAPSISTTRSKQIAISTMEVDTAPQTALSQRSTGMDSTLGRDILGRQKALQNRLVRAKMNTEESSRLQDDGQVCPLGKFMKPMALPSRPQHSLLFKARGLSEDMGDLLNRFDYSMISTIPCLLARPPSQSDTVILYFHANGEDIGQIERLCMGLANRLGVDYSLCRYG